MNVAELFLADFLGVVGFSLLSSLLIASSSNRGSRTEAEETSLITSLVFLIVAGLFLADFLGVAGFSLQTSLLIASSSSSNRFKDGGGRNLSNYFSGVSWGFPRS